MNPELSRSQGCTNWTGASGLIEALKHVSEEAFRTTVVALRDDLGSALRKKENQELDKAREIAVRLTLFVRGWAEANSSVDEPPLWLLRSGDYAARDVYQALRDRPQWLAEFRVGRLSDLNLDPGPAADAVLSKARELAQTERATSAASAQPGASLLPQQGMSLWGRSGRAWALEHPDMAPHVLDLEDAYRRQQARERTVHAV